MCVYTYTHTHMYIYIYIYIYICIYYFFIYILGCFSCPFFSDRLETMFKYALRTVMKKKKSNFENLYPWHARPDNRKNALFYQKNQYNACKLSFITKIL